MAVPKTSINEYYGPFGRKYDIRLPRKVSAMKTISISHTMEHLSNDQFGLGIGAFHLPHNFRSLGGRKGVCQGMAPPISGNGNTTICPLMASGRPALRVRSKESQLSMPKLLWVGHCDNLEAPALDSSSLSIRLRARRRRPQNQIMLDSGSLKS